MSIRNPTRIVEEITSPSITFTKLEAFFYFAVLSLIWGLVFWAVVTLIETAP